MGLFNLFQSFAGWSVIHAQEVRKYMVNASIMQRLLCHASSSLVNFDAIINSVKAP
jgi:hypothetical protein